jgi:hypothetical protein
MEMRVLGALVGAPTDESSESPMYASCLETIELQAQVQELISYKKGIWCPTYTYLADGGGQPLVRTFLVGGPGSLRPNKDTVVAAVGATKTCWTSGRLQRDPPHPHGQEPPAWEEAAWTS